MKNAIIIHGILETREELFDSPVSASNFSWLPGVQRQLVQRGILTQTPEMPTPYMPDVDFDGWVAVFEQFNIGRDTLLIGHSAGGGFLLKYLSLNPQINPGRLILVAPWLDIDAEHPTFFQNFDLDIDLPKRINRIDVLYSTDDMNIIIKSIDKIKKVYGNRINYHEFSDRGHFDEIDTGKDFPELLDVINQ
ncbi:MAG: hypothetical protein LBJ73_00855 [Rickettsiales bacterium]|jgi:predicted alpha/beta hydrolase family esterase|nr:hypothetical protein [Rickettsiales bacterium]